MRSLILVLALASKVTLAAAPEAALSTPENTPVDNSVTHYGDLYEVADKVNLRTMPSLQSKVIRTSKSGEVYFRLSNHHENGYIRMKDSEGKEFWIHQDYLQPVIGKKQ